MSGADTQKLLNVNEVATQLGLSVSYLNKLRLSREGPKFLKFGHRVAYVPADLAEWIETRRRASTSEYNGPKADA